MIQKPVTHVGLILDASTSMRPVAESLIKVVDSQVAHLVRRSKELDQETRISIWVFNDHAQCVVWDMDVLRLPSIRQLYIASGNTALIDGTLLALTDLSTTPQKYGDHAFLLYLFTDGEENCSRSNAAKLKDHIKTLADNWTLGGLVPNIDGIHELKRHGFPANNIMVWDATSAKGVEEAGIAVAAATDSYMTARTISGLRGTNNLFNLDVTAVSTATLTSTGLNPLAMDKFQLIPVGAKVAEIRDFVVGNGLPFAIGRSFYELSKRETIQANKALAMVNKKTRQVFVGHEVRSILGLPAHEVKVDPAKHTDYEIYVQSGSHNRKLMPGTKLLVLV